MNPEDFLSDFHVTENMVKVALLLSSWLAFCCVSIGHLFVPLY